MSLNAAPVRWKLTLIVMLLMVPITLLAWLFVSQSFKDIDFARKERDGVVYLRGVWPVLSSLTNASGPAVSPKEVAGLPALADAHAANLASAEAAKSMADALAAIGWPGAKVERSAKLEKAIGEVRTLVTKISDGSSLTLDPDLGSYYVMDVASIKLPETIDRAGSVVALIGQQREKSVLSDDDKTELLIQIGLFANVSSGVAPSLAAAYKSNPDGKTVGALNEKEKQLTQHAERFVAETKRIAIAMHDDTQRGVVDTSRMMTLYRGLHAQSDTLWQSAADELDRLLVLRIDGFSSRLWMMLGIAGFVVLLALGLTGIIARQIAMPLRQLREAIHAIAAGDYSVALPALGRKDEIGEISGTVNGLRDALADAAQMRNEQDTLKQLADDERRATMSRLADEFEVAVGRIVISVADAADTLEGSATTLTKTARGAEEMSVVAASASEQASISVRSIAEATVRMTHSVQDIAQHVGKANEIAQEAVQQAVRTDTRIGDLSTAASRIGDVVKLISSIASQTNLLALNATIEAARAGDAGRGFAIVAHEVKELASQTASATNEISSQITDIQNATADSVTAIQDISRTIRQISDVSEHISQAVERQDQTANVISVNIAQAAAGTNQIVSNSNALAQSVTETGHASDDVLHSVHSLSSEIRQLKQEVAHFVSVVRAA